MIDTPVGLMPLILVNKFHAVVIDDYDEMKRILAMNINVPKGRGYVYRLDVTKNIDILMSQKTTH